MKLLVDLLCKFCGVKNSSNLQVSQDWILKPILLHVCVRTPVSSPPYLFLVINLGHKWHTLSCVILQRSRQCILMYGPLGAEMRLHLTFLLCALHLIQHFLVVISDQMLALFPPEYKNCTSVSKKWLKRIYTRVDWDHGSHARELRKLQLPWRFGNTWYAINHQRGSVIRQTVCTDSSLQRLVSANRHGRMLPGGAVPPKAESYGTPTKPRSPGPAPRRTAA